MKKKIVKTINYKEFEFEENGANGTWKQIGDKTVIKTSEFEGSYFEEETMKKINEYK